jgi:hypothetical protein
LDLYAQDRRLRQDLGHVRDGRHLPALHLALDHHELPCVPAVFTE